jgi:prefoldin subunit 5
LKDKYSKKEQVIQQDIELIAERIASLTTSATSLEEFEPPLKRRKIFRAEDVLDAKRLQMRKELDDIDADIERWRQYVQHISNQLCTLRMVNPLQLVRMMGMDFGKARSYGVDICFED